MIVEIKKISNCWRLIVIFKLETEPVKTKNHGYVYELVSEAVDSLQHKTFGLDFIEKSFTEFHSFNGKLRMSTL